MFLINAYINEDVEKKEIEHTVGDLAALATKCSNSFDTKFKTPEIRLNLLGWACSSTGILTQE
jgi:hypothetical protein